MFRSAIPLTKVTTGEGRAVLVPHHNGPTLQGTGKLDYTCPQCSQVLAASLEPDQVFDIVIECWPCKTLSEFPRLPIGAKASGYAYFPAGHYRLDSTVTMPKGALSIGIGAIQG